MQNEIEILPTAKCTFNCVFKRNVEGLMESRPGCVQKALQNGRLFIDISVLRQALNGTVGSSSFASISSLRKLLW